MASTENYDLLILTDATLSMGSYLQALQNSLPEIIRISALTSCFSRIGVAAYRDYCGGKLTEWSGWYGLNDGPARRAQVLSFVKMLRPSHGGDWPEAAKTGLACAYQQMRSDAKTIILFYADAPPHTGATGGNNRASERMELRKKDKYGEDAACFIDWVSATNTLRQGKKKAQVFSIVQNNLADTLAPFTFLSTQTGGVCLELEKECGAAAISKVTLGVLLAWMGVEKEGAKTSTEKLVQVCQYKDQGDINQVASEDDDLSNRYFVRKDTVPLVQLVKDNLQKTKASLDGLKQFVPARQDAASDFSKRYREDEAYRKLVVEHLRDIIDSDVAAVTLNPVFGSLWRTVCNDRLNETRDELIQAFGAQVEAITNPDKRARMKEWLEESYDYAGEVLSIIQSVPEDEQYPCVLLDPTLDFNKPAPTEVAAEGSDGDDDTATNPTDFSRADLLEIGRSCDYRILRRLGRVLTRMTYIATEDEIPAHIKNEPKDKVPRIPLALVQPKHHRKFWKVLLHAFLQGTLLAPRPAALLAALSLRMGMLPLRDAADAELLHFKQNWNTLDIPETWNTNCLALLLDADKDFEGRIAEGITKRPAAGAAFLSADDRKLFKTLVDYKLMEMNMGTTLSARIGWHPEKDKAAMGPTTVCKACHFPRSVTIMAANGTCGLCDKDSCDCASPEAHDEAIQAHVSTDDNEKTQLAWVECAVISCRAHYVVYNREKLRVRPKCFYCRKAGRSADDTKTPTTAPFVECTTCLSRIIWPLEYRPADLDTTTFTCPACTTDGITTIVDTPTTPATLVANNGTGWLLRNDDNKIRNPFSNRSLFHVISTAGTDGFAGKVAILPPPTTTTTTTTTATTLTLQGKLIRNQEALLSELRGWIDTRRAQGADCSLCFASHKKSKLRSACGRTGCASRICDSCWTGWYGLNARGRLLNVAALSCPFCRRRPAPSAVTPFGLHLLGGLRTAVDESGAWVHGWCNRCGFARRYIERVCARGPPAEVEHWACDDCKEADGGGVCEIKQCPGCGTSTEKTGGCDHIECIIEGCGAHWCFNCGKQVPLDQIYDHMTREHGGWYGGEEYEEEENGDLSD